MIQNIFEKKRGQRNLLLCSCLFFLIGCELFFFRNVLFSDRLIGDAWDGRLTMLFTEHWYHVFRGEAKISDMGFFYPAANTLAYSDMFFFFGLIHSLLRFIGIDIYVAFKVTLICIHLIGTFSIFWLLNKELETDCWWAVFGTIAFSFSSTYAIHISHTQMLTVGLVPLFTIFSIRFFRNFTICKKRRWNVALSILILMIILYTAWYVFFFTALFIVTGMVIWLIRAIVNCRYISRTSNLDQIKDLIPEFVIYGIVLVLMMLPFILLELPVLHMSGGRSYAEVSVALPEPIDFINVSEENWLIGSFIKKLKLGERNYTFEVIEGFSFVLVLSFICFCIVTKKRKNTKQLKNAYDEAFFTQTIAMTIITSCLLCMRLSCNGVSFWWFIFSLFPGGKSIRAVARYLLFLSFPLASITALMGSEVTRRIREFKIAYIALMIGMIVLTFLAGIHVGGVFSRWTKAESEEFLSTVPAPPEDCESFFLSDVIEGQSGPYYQLDAYQIADKYGVKTIHGYSGLNPSGWSDMWDVHGKNYVHAVNSWIMANHLQNVYAYNEIERTWTKYEPQDNSESLFDARKKIIPELISGIWDFQPEGEYCWTQQNVIIRIHNKDISEKGMQIEVGTVFDKYLRQNPGLNPECTIYVNNTYLGEIPVIDGREVYHYKIEASENDIYEIVLKTNCFFVPAEIGENGDSRKLALQLYYIGPVE